MKFQFLFLILLTSSCSFTAPDGVKELEKDILRDKKNLSQAASNPLVGEAQFVKVRVYPQITDGNIIGEHWLLLQVGRKNLHFEDLLRRIHENDQSSSE